MARRAQKRSPRRESATAAETGAANGGDGTSLPPAPGTTGRYLILFDRSATPRAAQTLSNLAGLSMASTADFDSGVAQGEDMGGADALLFPDLGIAVTSAPPEQTMGVASEESGVLAIEPERIVYPSGGDLFEPAMEAPVAPPAAPGLPLEYLRGYRDAVTTLYDRLAEGGGDAAETDAAIAFVPERELTWGLQATRVAHSRFAGRGVRVAVLDTGLDPGHPDFVGRAIQTASFISGETVQDGNGHGTHCIGTACGPLRPQSLPRYGIAYESEIFAGKVLSNGGRGSDGGILNGIQWAITNGCAIVSMSLGAPVQVGQSFSQVFEHAARRALLAKTLIIAAAGNESRRPHSIKPVAHPANCPSIMAVGAVSRYLRVADFSCGGLNPQGGQVDIAGPGVAIRSSWPRPTLYRTIDGTSMATPHVAGVAALYAQADASFRGRVLMSILTQYARRLWAPARDVGAGLVQVVI